MLESIDLPNEWHKFLKNELSKEYIINLKTFLFQESQKHHIYPSTENIFSAFFFTKPKNIKIVILGQDPYHGPEQAHGLSFSVPRGLKIPPSLKNIYKELENNNINFSSPDHGHLEAWAKQGVFLLNSVLTVRSKQAASHKNKGWEKFTDTIISILDQKYSHIVFLLWGSYAQKKGKIINKKKHLVLSSVHPSPLSAHRGFFGNNHFKQANEYLEANNKKAINWNKINEE